MSKQRKSGGRPARHGRQGALAPSSSNLALVSLLPADAGGKVRRRKAQRSRVLPGHREEQGLPWRAFSLPFTSPWSPFLATARASLPTCGLSPALFFQLGGQKKGRQLPFRHPAATETHSSRPLSLLFAPLPAFPRTCYLSGRLGL